MSRRPLGSRSTKKLEELGSKAVALGPARDPPPGHSIAPRRERRDAGSRSRRYVPRSRPAKEPDSAVRPGPRSRTRRRRPTPRGRSSQRRLGGVVGVGLLARGEHLTSLSCPPCERLVQLGRRGDRQTGTQIGSKQYRLCERAGTRLFGEEQGCAPARVANAYGSLEAQRIDGREDICPESDPVEVRAGRNPGLSLPTQIRAPRIASGVQGSGRGRRRPGHGSPWHALAEPADPRRRGRARRC